MTHSPSLQRRLAIGLVFGVTIMWLAATLFAGLIVRHELDGVFDSAIQETAQRLLPLAVADILDREDGAAGDLVTFSKAHAEFLTYLVRDETGRILMQSHDTDPAIFPPYTSDGFHDTATHRIYTEAAVRGTITIAVSEPLEHRQEAAMDATSAMAWPLLVLIPISYLGVWWFVRRALSPVLAIRDAIETRGSGDLTPIGADGLPQEIGPIAEAVNHLLERLRRAFDAERSFTANSAHELRTPIAAALAQTQRLMAEVKAGPVQDRARQIETALHRLARLSEKLMQLAKAEGGGLVADHAEDLIPYLQFTLDDFRRSGTSPSRLAVSLPEGSVLSLIDPDAFTILARNLIENALKHGAANQPVSVILSRAGDFSVTNDGPVVPRQMLMRLTRPFERGQSEADGTGLGLAIAAAIATGAGSNLVLSSPARDRDQGFEASVKLPVP